MQAVLGESRALIRVMEPKVVNPELSLGRLQDVANLRVFSNFGPQVLELKERFAELALLTEITESES